MQTIYEFAATLAAGLFTGAALFIHFVEHPARMELGPPLAVTEFIASYKRAAVMQPSLALLGLVAGYLAWQSGANYGWLLGGGAMGFLFPFTIIWMLPINNRLHDPELEANPALGMELLGRWGRLHSIRCLIGFGSFLLFLLLLRWA